MMTGRSLKDFRRATELNATFDSVIYLPCCGAMVDGTLHVRMERELLSGMAFRVVLLALLVVFTTVAPARAHARHWSGCADQYSVSSFALPNGYPFDVARAKTLFRFHRQQQALRELDAGRAIVRGPWRWRVPSDMREELTASLDALRNCLARTKPPQLATLTVRVLGYGREGGGTLRPQAGARLLVDGILVGRTGRDGTLTVRVPSGPIEVQAEIPINQASFAEVDLAPGESGALEIGLSDGKEVDEHTTLVFAEAVDDIVPVNARSLTLKFMQEGRPAPVTSIDAVDAEDLEGNLRTDLTGHFTVVRGAIVAANPARVFEALRPQFSETIVLQVQAMSSSDAMHYGRIAFRVGQWPLSVTLEAPPSNRALSVANIEVGISMLGAGIAVQRVSDANGRLEVASLPEGTVAFECVAVSGGNYYYGDATLAHSGPQSITLVMRNVDDLKNGVAPLRVDKPTAKDEVPLARTVQPSPSREADIARILVQSAERGRTIAMSTMLTVRRGTERLMLAYDIATLEQRRAPRFDDVWTLSVFDRNGRSLLHIIRNVGSQDRVHPNWQPGNRTGRIQEFFDISRHTARSDVSFTLVGTATNSGDDRDSTTVEALITPVDKKWGPTRRFF